MRCLNYHLETFYGKYAFVVYRHPWFFIILPVAATLCLSVGFTLFDDRMINDTTYLFTPDNTQHRYEKAVVLEHWPLIEDADYDKGGFIPGLSIDYRHWFFIVITPKNKTNGLWNNETLDKIQEFNDYIENNFTVQLGDYIFKYTDICLRSNWQPCYTNSHIFALRYQNFYSEYEVPPLSYPINREYLSNEPSLLGYLIGDATVNYTDNNRLLDFGAVRLVYFTRRFKDEDGRDMNVLSIQWRSALQDYLLNQYESDELRIAFGNEDTLNQGLLENSSVFAPQLCITFALMLTFSFLNSFVIMQRTGFVGIDWVRSKPLLACFGVTEPGLAIISTIGFMLLIGVPYHPGTLIMPFLVFAIGVDDMFIMISAWHNTKKSDPPDVRFSHTLSDAAVSITITSVSDILAFGVGSWNCLPGIKAFAIYTSVAFFFELIYQCTFYAAAMALFAKAECEGKHCYVVPKAMSLEEAKTKFQRRFQVGTILAKPLENSASQSDADQDLETNFVQKLFHNYYIPTLLRPVTKIAALLLFFIYLGFAGWGCAVMTSGLPAEKLMLKGHYSVEFIHSSSYWVTGTPVQIIVSNPPNMTNSTARNKMLEIASAFESTTHSMNSSGTFFWLREYLLTLNRSDTSIEDTQDQWCYGIKAWLRTDSKGYRINSLKWANESEDSDDYCKITAFRFVVSTIDFYEYMSMVNTVSDFRDICDQYAQYNVSIFNEYTPYADQYLAVNPTMIRNGILAIVLMIMISMLMIPHPVCGIFITLATVSIDTGVTGFLAWWNVNMDSLSMTCMFMATGFAIDLSAHVSYAYIRSPGTSKEKVTRALEELGWPVFQGVTSTFLGVLVLGTVDAYMFTTFFKTIFLVIIFGILHCLFFLPIALVVFAPTNFSCCKRTKKEKPNQIFVNGDAKNENEKANDVVLTNFNRTNADLENGENKIKKQ